MATINRYDIGDLVRVTGTLTDADGTATDPNTVAFKIKTPAGATTTYTYGVDAEVKKSATGIYYMDVSTTAEGNWYYRIYSTGTGQAAAEGTFIVKTSDF